MWERHLAAITVAAGRRSHGCSRHRKMPLPHDAAPTAAYCTEAHCSSVATMVRTSYCATTSLSWFVTSVSHRTSP